MTQKWSFSAAISAAATVAVSLAAPGLWIYFANRGEFTFAPGMVAGVFALGGAGVVFLLTALQWSWRRSRFFGWGVALLMGTGIFLWLQGMFYREFFPAALRWEGEWGAYVWLVVLNLVALLLPFAVCFWQRRVVVAQAGKIAGVVILAQVLPLLEPLCNQRNPSYDYFEYSLVDKDKFTFAAADNIIVLVVDAMGEAKFKSVLAGAPELRTALRDFCVFDRMSSPVPRTAYAVPALLTGVAYTGDWRRADGEPHDQYLRRACYDDDSLWMRLRQAGYRCEAYPFILQTVCFSPSVLDNVTWREEHTQSIRQFTDFWLARFVPFILQRLLGDYGQNLTGRFVAPGEGAGEAFGGSYHDINFYRALQTQARKGEFRCGFKYLHLQGAHDPIATDENLSPNFGSDVTRQLRGSLRNVELLLEKLRELGLYEAATIVITGDHSEKYTPEVVTLIKRPGEKRPALAWNSAAVEIADIAPTILAIKALGGAERSVFSRRAVRSGGAVRDYREPETLVMGSWREAVCAVRPEHEFSPSASLNLADGAIFLRYGGEGPAPGRVALGALALNGGKTYLTDPVEPATAHRPERYRAEYRGLPPGDYLIFLRESPAPSPSDGASGVTAVNVLAGGYLRLGAAGAVLSDVYPGMAAATLVPDSPVALQRFQPTPGVIWSEHCTLGTHGLRWPDSGVVTLRLPPGAEPLTVTLEMRTAIPEKATLALISADTLLFSAEICAAITPQTFEFPIPRALRGAPELPITLKIHAPGQLRRRAPALLTLSRITLR